MVASYSHDIFFLIQHNQCYMPLKILLEEKKYDCTVYYRLHLLRLALDKKPPQALLMDIQLLDELPNPAMTIKAIQQLHAIPLIALSDSSDLTWHIKALRMGFNAYFSAPINYPLALERLNELMYPQTAPSYRILIVDDDVVQLKMHQLILRKAGMDVYGLREPLQIITVLQQFHPHLILMDLYMPDVTGKELVTIIRSYREYQHIPIVFLSGEDNETIQFEVLEAGGDDFLVKPIRPNHLVAALINRVQRAQVVQQDILALSEQDVTTGLLNRPHFIKKLDALLQYPPHSHPIYGILYIALDDMMSQNQWDIASIDSIMEQLGQLIGLFLTAEDCIARFEDTIITVLLNRDTGRALLAVAEHCCQWIQRQLFVAHNSLTTTASIGVSLYREEFTQAGQWVSCAEKACHTAHKLGGNRVHLYLHSQTRPTLSESDEETATIALLQQTLRNHGFQFSYQPIIALSGKRKELFQLQIQMPSAHTHRINQDKLFAVADSSGLAIELDRWIIQQMLSLLDQQYQQGKATEVMVRLTVSSLKDKSHLDWLRQQFIQHALGMRGLIFEITQANASVDLQITRQRVKELRQIGVRCCLTEFDGSDNAFLLLEHLTVSYIKFASWLTMLPATLKPLISQLHTHYKIMAIIPNIDSANIAAQLWDSEADYIQGLFIHSPDSDLSFEFMTTGLIHLKH